MLGQESGILLWNLDPRGYHHNGLTLGSGSCEQDSRQALYMTAAMVS